jgi:hypothetical protein
VKIFAVAKSSVLSLHPVALNSPAVLLCRAGNVRVRRGENYICTLVTRNKGIVGDADAHSVCCQARRIPRTRSDLFVYDDRSTTRQINRLIRLTRYGDRHTVNAEVAKKTTLANWWSTRWTRAL